VAPEKKRQSAAHIDFDGLPSGFFLVIAAALKNPVTPFPAHPDN
jgi:hypothetical protein